MLEFMKKKQAKKRDGGRDKRRRRVIPCSDEIKKERTRGGGMIASIYKIFNNF